MIPVRFEITPERLGCYLPTTHIDNPKVPIGKDTPFGISDLMMTDVFFPFSFLPFRFLSSLQGYPDDARSFDPRLRGPVDPRELEVDPRTGMKNCRCTAQVAKLLSVLTNPIFFAFFFLFLFFFSNRHC
jgi:hypothetical protein